MRKLFRYFIVCIFSLVSSAVYSASFGLAIDGEDKGVFGKEVPNAGALGVNADQNNPFFLNIAPGDPGWVDEDFDLVHDACDNNPNDHKDRFNLCTGQTEPMVLGARNKKCKLVTYPESAINQHHDGHVCGAGWSLASVRPKDVRIYIGGGRSITRRRYSILPSGFANHCGPLIPSGIIQTAGPKDFGINFRNWKTSGSKWADKGHEWSGKKLWDYWSSGGGSYATNFSWPTTTSDARANVCVQGN